MIDVRNLRVSYGDFAAVKDVTFHLGPEEILMITGPNGAGKSTLINAISGALPFSGEVRIAGKSLQSYKPKDLARLIGVLSQNHSVSYSFSVEDVVCLGRYAYRKGLQGDVADEGSIEKALEMTGLTKFRNRSVLELSGGELQRVFLAQLFAQDPHILILDEPTNHLDLVYQEQIFGLIGDWTKEEDRAVISVVHDLSLAKSFGTHALLLKEGSVLAQGEASDVLCSAFLDEAYGMDVTGWMQKLLSQWD